MKKQCSLFFLLFAAAACLCAEVTVGRGGDFLTIREAIAAAGTEPSVFLLLDPIYTESGLVIENDVELKGRGIESTIIQAAAEPGTAVDRVFTVTSTGNAVFSKLTIRNGRPSAIPHRGGGIDNEGRVRLENCALTGNEAVYGGAVFTRGRVEMNGCSISGNYTTQLPNKLINTGIGCRGSGGALKTEKGGELIIDNSCIWDNSAFRRGGGIFIACESSARITNSTIAENHCRKRGGGIYNNGDLFLNHVTIANNSSMKRGSGLSNRGRLSMRASLIAGSSFQDFYIAAGGGIYGEGFLEVNEGNFVADGSLEGAASGDPLLGRLRPGGSNPPFMLPGIFTPARLEGMADTTPGLDQRGRTRGRKPYIGACEGRLIFRLFK